MGSKLYHLARARARKNSVSNLKDRNFSQRLAHDYNTEELAYYTTTEDTFKAIVQMSTYNYSIESRILDYQKVSVPFSANVQIGDILYWARMKKNYLVFANRDTEKNYLICYMSPADYEITWYDKYGNKQTQVGSFLQTAKEDIKTSGNLYDYLDASMQLLLKKTAATDDLNYYDKIWINEKNWQIVGKSSSTFPGMVAIYLKEVPYNQWTDVKDGLPAGSEVTVTEIITSYDTIEEVTLGNTNALNLATLVNGNAISDSYTVLTQNCSYDKDTYTLTFNTIGTAKITISSTKTTLTKTISILVKEEEVQTISYSIEGDKNVATFLTYKYSAYKNTNGTKEPMIVNWSLMETELAIIEETSDNNCYIHMSEDCGTITLIAQSAGGEIARKEIIIESVY